MAYRTARPDFGSAARHPEQLEIALRDFHGRLEKIEKATNTQAEDSGQRKPVAAKPPQALMRVMPIAGQGHWKVIIRNPEFGNLAGTGRHVPRHIYHQLEYSPDPDFARNVTRLDPSHQTYFPITDKPGQKMFFRLTSSHDGEHWNLPLLSGPHVA